VLTLDAAANYSDVVPVVAIYDTTSDGDDVWLFDLDTSNATNPDITIVAVDLSLLQPSSISVSGPKPYSKEGCGVNVSVVSPASQPQMDAECTAWYTNGTNSTITNPASAVNTTTVDGYIMTSVVWFVPAEEDEGPGEVTCIFSVGNLAVHKITKMVEYEHFPDFQPNPLGQIPKVPDGATYRTSDEVQGCFGSMLEPIAEVECSNGNLVTVYGRGNDWNVSTSTQGSFAYDATKTDLYSLVNQTCGSASIFPAALLVTLVSVFNIFK